MEIELVGDAAILVRSGLDTMDPMRRQTIYPGDELPDDLEEEQCVAIIQHFASTEFKDRQKAQAEADDAARAEYEAAEAKEQAEKDATFAAEVRRQLIAAGILK